MGDAAISDPVFSAGQLYYTLGNPHAPGTIYVSSDPAANQLHLVMSSTVVAGFTAGTLVPPDQAPGGSGSLLYLDLTPLGLTDAEFNALKLVADGWTSALYSGASGQYVGFTPAGPVSLQPCPATISFALNAFTMATQPGSSASLSVLAYRVSGVTSGFPIFGNIAVVFQLPDDNQGDLTTAIQVTIDPAQVVNSIDGYPSISNQLVLTLKQNPNATTVMAGAVTAFTLNFIYASDVNGYGALLTVDEGKEVAVTAAQGITTWKIKANLDADPPFWTLLPPPNAAIFGTPPEPIAFDIGNVVTTFQPGPTVVLLGYSNVQDYRNGSFAITLLKQPHVEISPLTVTPPQSTLTDGSASVTLGWQATYAASVMVEPPGADVTGSSSYTAKIGGSTAFTLTAEGQRPGNVDNVATASATAEVLPVINSFTASPSSFYADDFATGCRANLSWNVNTNETVTLASSATGPFGPDFPPVSSTDIELETPQTLTLAIAGGGDTAPVSRTITVSGFEMEIELVPINPFFGGWVAMPPNGGFVAVSVFLGEDLLILSPVDGSLITTVQLGWGGGCGIAFSPDSSLMYVASGTAVKIFSVANAPGSPAFIFTPADSVSIGSLGSMAWSIVVGSDGTAWVSTGDSNAGQVVGIANSGGQFSLGAPVAIGQTPIGLAISPSGEALYAACFDTGNVFRVDIGGAIPVAETLLTGFNQPLGIAVTPDGATLLVADNSALYGYSTLFPAHSPHTYPLPGVSSVTPFPTGTYAVAASTTGETAGSIALLNCAAETVSTVQQTSASSFGACMAPDGSSCFVALQDGVARITFPPDPTLAAPRVTRRQRTRRRGHGGAGGGPNPVAPGLLQIVNRAGVPSDPRAVGAAASGGFTGTVAERISNRASAHREDRP